MTNNKLRVGLIGANVNYGWGTRAHIPAILALPEFELAAICTAHQNTATETAHHFGVELAFDDHRKLVSDPTIDVIAVSVRVPHHHALTMAALDSGKHVFTEWPLGRTLSEAEEMASLATKNQLQAMIGLQGRGSPELLHIKDLVANGYIGNPLSCVVTQYTGGFLLNKDSGRSWMGDSSMGVNPLTVGFAHLVDWLGQIIGPFVEISGHISTQIPVWTEIDTGKEVSVSAPDTIMITGLVKTGAQVSITVGNVPHLGSGMRLELHGTKGTIVATSEQAASIGPVKVFGAQDDSTSPALLETPQALRLVPDNTPTGAPYNVAQMYRLLASSINSGQPLVHDFQAAVCLHNLLETIKFSSETGERTSMDDQFQRIKVR